MTVMWMILTSRDESVPVLSLVMLPDLLFPTVLQIILMLTLCMYSKHALYVTCSVLFYMYGSIILYYLMIILYPSDLSTFMMTVVVEP